MTGGQAYYPLTVSNADFERSPTIEFPYVMARLLLIRDSFEGDVYFSYNGRDIDGKLTWEDESLDIGEAEVSKIWFKSTVVDAKIRVYATA